uniref:Cytidyltransferase-like domain-containing protein n=1 Tax=Bionectria ochroleuca TaxID=29856 RepID=A0A8H7NEV5_BIOOC
MLGTKASKSSVATCRARPTVRRVSRQPTTASRCARSPPRMRPRGSCSIWEAQRPVFTPTARVLDHFDYEINHVMGGIECTDGTRKRAKIVLLAGADLIQTLSTPGVWDARDVDHILSHYGTFVLERNGTELDSAIANLKQWEHNIHVVRQVVSNDVSSTKVRLLIKRDMSIDYLIPDAVIDYIYENNLYKVDFDLPPLPEPKGKERATSNGATSGPSDG